MSQSPMGVNIVRRIMSQSPMGVNIVSRIMSQSPMRVNIVSRIISQSPMVVRGFREEDRLILRVTGTSMFLLALLRSFERVTAHTLFFSMLMTEHRKV